MTENQLLEASDCNENCQEEDCEIDHSEDCRDFIESSTECSVKLYTGNLNDELVYKHVPVSLYSRNLADSDIIILDQVSEESMFELYTTLKKHFEIQTKSALKK